jgi:hypothetical protein
MKKVALLGLGGLMFVSAAANAISFSGQAGRTTPTSVLDWDGNLRSGDDR